MLIKFFPNGKGGGAGPVNYLTDRTVLAYDENRDLIRDKSGQPQHVIRDPLPEVLRGDAQIMTDLIDACPHKWSYRAGVISFAVDDSPNENEQREVMDRFEELAFAGLDGDQFSCLWVRHTHEDRVELHFCTPRMELHSGRSLNIAPPGYERAFDSLRDLMNKEHAWADPMDAQRTAETKKVTEAPERAVGREALHGWIRDQIDEGLIADRAEMTAVLTDAGFEVPRAGKEYITVKDPDTGERWRLKGEIFHENWTAETAVEREAKRGLGTDAQRERRLDASTVAELQGRFESHCAKRAGYNQDRYGNLSADSEEAPYDSEQQAHAARSTQDILDARGERLRDDQLGPVDMGHGGDDEAQPDLFRHEDRRDTGGDLSGADKGSGELGAVSRRDAVGGLLQSGRALSDGWSDAVGARIADLRRAVDGSLESIGAGIKGLRGAVGPRNQNGIGWAETLRDRAGQIAAYIDRCLGWLDAGRSDLRAAIGQAQGQLGERDEGGEATRHALTQETEGEERHGLRH